MGGWMGWPHRRWIDRRDAGLALAGKLDDFHGRRHDSTLVALPRGGVPVAAAMAEVLHLPLVSWAVRKLAHPDHPEFAIGAVAPGDVTLWDEDDPTVRRLDARDRASLEEAQRRELLRRQRRFGDPPAAALRGRHLIVVDDGIATGMTARAALVSLRGLAPSELVLAVPVVDRSVVPVFENLVDRLEALMVVERLRAVGEWYEHFPQLEDQDVLALLPGRVQ